MKKLRGCGEGEGIKVLMRGGNGNRNIFPHSAASTANDHRSGDACLASTRPKIEKVRFSLF